MVLFRRCIITISGGRLPRSAMAISTRIRQPSVRRPGSRLITRRCIRNFLARIIISSLLAWYYGNSAVNGNHGAFPGILQTQDFAPIPANWQAAVIDAILGVDPLNGASTGFGMNGRNCTAFE